MPQIRRAIISVYNKEGLMEFARGLHSKGIQILSTGGTAKFLKEGGIAVLPVEEYTGFPDLFGGRVKTLHPKIFGGILWIRGNSNHERELEECNILPIDMVVVNLYPFEKVIEEEDVTLEKAIENIDIGGVSLIRAAAKNYPFVTVLVDPSSYPSIIQELNEQEGSISLETNLNLAIKAFQHCVRYDAIISNYLGTPGKESSPFPSTFLYMAKKVQDLRYGENPHQRAAFYVDDRAEEPCVSRSLQIHGKELSFNNILDLNEALETVKEFEEPCAVIIKHTNPCGAAISRVSLADAFKKALETDPVSAFGGIVGFNRKLDVETAEEMAEIFSEAVIAPDYDEEALQILRKKKNLRLLKVPFMPGYKGVSSYASTGFDLRKVVAGLLVQDRDVGDFTNTKVVTKRQPTEKELSALNFAWKICKHVKSNAIVFSKEDQLVGVGAGQMSRVDSCKIAIMKANMPTKGTVVASDAFFPFRDALDVIAQAGATAVIQPGGSIRDQEVIQAADEHNIAMVFTGFRHFRH